MSDRRSRRRSEGPLPGLRTLPFGVAGLLGVLFTLPGAERPGLAWVVVVTAVLEAMTAVVLPWQRLPRWLPTVLALATLGTIGLLLVAVGEEPAGAVSLVMVPVFWIALFGTWIQLIVVLLAVPFVMMWPAWLPGTTLPLDSTAASAGAVTAVAAALGYAAHHLVEEVRTRRRAEAAAHRRMQMILDTSPDTAVLTWSTERVITGLNRGAASLFGFTQEEAVGRLSPADLIGDEALAALSSATGFANPADPDAENDDLLASNRWSSEDRSVSGVTARIPSRVGEVWAHLDLSAVVDDLGWAREYVLVAHDITDLQHAQHDLEAVRRDLATVVAMLHQAQSGKDVRLAVCRETRRLVGADVVVMLELEGRELSVSAHDGRQPESGGLPVDHERAAAARAYRERSRVRISDLQVSELSAHPVGDGGLRALIAEPVVHEGEVVALLCVGWDTPVSGLPARVEESVQAMAREAGAAMYREDDVRSLQTRAREDALTGLPNRREWDLQVSTALAAGRDEPVCLAMLDLDHFKAFNDSRGHQAGDALLQSAARAWRRQLRSHDLLARYGGEEFGVLLRGCGREEALAVLDRLRKATPEPATVSIGAAYWDGREGPSALVGRADAALYAAKRRGRDRVVVDGG